MFIRLTEKQKKEARGNYEEIRARIEKRFKIEPGQKIELLESSKQPEESFLARWIMEKIANAKRTTNNNSSQRD